jgi:hypothetical protein
MAQGVLSFQYEEERVSSGMTALSGLPVYLDLAHVMGISESIRRQVHVREGSQGWTDEQVILSLILLNLAGGEAVEDLRILEADEGFCRVLRRVETQGMRRRERRELERRWRKEQRRAVPSPSAIFRYLSAFHDGEQESRRQAGKAFIPAPNRHLQGLVGVNRDLLAFVQSRREAKTATLDMDATLVAAYKAGALYCYQHFKAYQPLNVRWAEQGMVVHTEFRDGNVPAGYEQRRVLEAALASLPAGVEKVYLREDTAGYEWDLLTYCAEGKHERFGVIEFAVGADVTPEFKKAVAQVADEEWQPLRRRVEGQWQETAQQWAEVCFVPNTVGHKKGGPSYRFIAIREPLEQPALPGMSGQAELPFPTMSFEAQGVYKVFGIVTNRDLPGEELIRWYRERCGKSEEAHGVMKEDLAGGKLPSGDFGENAAWWWIMILALNLNEAMKQLVLGGSWVTKRMKAIRFALIHLPGRVKERSRQLIVRLGHGHPSLETLLTARQRIAALVPQPSG